VRIAAGAAILYGMQVIVDNRAGEDARFAEAVVRGLREQGLAVEFQEPVSVPLLDTSVHLIAAGLKIRVSEPPDRATSAKIRSVVTEALRHHPSVRRRTRSVPVHLGESHRVLEWIDAVG
jgi:hypothetical protein